MYYDEDGDLAHEFYRQVVRNDKVTMERCLDNLIPQVSYIHRIMNPIYLFSAC